MFVILRDFSISVLRSPSFFDVGRLNGGAQLAARKGHRHGLQCRRGGILGGEVGVLEGVLGAEPLGGVVGDEGGEEIGGAFGTVQKPLKICVAGQRVIG